MRWEPIDVAKEAAVAMEDLAIEEVAHWAGSAEEFGMGVYDELFDDSHLLRPVYQAATAELLQSSLVRNDTTAVVAVLCRLAATQWFLRGCVKNYGQ